MWIFFNVIINYLYTFRNLLGIFKSQAQRCRDDGYHKDSFFLWKFANIFQEGMCGVKENYSTLWTSATMDLAPFHHQPSRSTLLPFTLFSRTNHLRLKETFHSSSDAVRLLVQLSLFRSILRRLDPEEPTLLKNITWCK